MDKGEKLKELYGGLKVEELKNRLRNKGAKVSGRKVELVDRLVHYEVNDDFGYEQVKKDEVLQTPPVVNYKDINSSSPYPAFTENHLIMFAKKYDVQLNKADKIYNSGFLLYVRYSIATDQTYFLKAACRAEIKKHMKYNVDINLTMDGEIQGTSCDCPVGHSTEAHCKHVLVLLTALKEFVQKKQIVVEQTCTQVLQTFHKPAKKYTGSPMQAGKFRKRVLPAVCDEPSDDFKMWYKDYFRNLVISRGINCNMSIKQIVEPANIYGVEWDHSLYTKQSNTDRLLEFLHLKNITEESIAKIELYTRQQSESKDWGFQRTIRLTASIFHSCCKKYENPEGAKALVNRILNPEPFNSKATDLGKIHEKSAVKKLQEIYNDILEITECGLFVSLDRPHLGATPDRLLYDNSVIEIKCPYSNRHEKINEKTVPYLSRDSNNNLTLKNQHPYFYQVQGQLYATGRQFCEFVVYTFVDICIIPIKRDENFITSMLLKLDYFYVTYLKPAVIEKYLYKNYEEAFFTDDVLRSLSLKRFNNSCECSKVSGELCSHT